MSGTYEGQEVYENRQMRILSAIGIFLVVAGHLGYSVFEIGDLFPYYSFHVFIFLFVAGYFYKPEEEERILLFIVRKAYTLLLPYFIWNLIYGGLTVLLHRMGFSIGEGLSLKTLFLSPFLDGHQFLYHFPAWFVPALFLVEVIQVCLRRILTFLRLNHEWFILAGCLIVGMATVWLAKGGHVWGYYKFPGRLLLMMPGFCLGRIYKEKLEAWDTLSDGWYLFIVMAVQVLVSIFCNGLAYSVVWCSGFANGPWIPYVTVVTGLAFWLRVSRILSRWGWAASRLCVVGRNTYSIMMHHILGFMVVKSFFYLLYQHTSLCAGFDVEMYFSEINFLYLPGGSEAGKWIYIFVGIGLPLLIARGQEKVTGILRRG